VTEPTAEQPQVTATVSPAVPPRSRWGAIPRHLGRARTSTVVLTLLFLAVGALWLNIRPDPEAATPVSGGGTVVDQPATVVPTTPAPTTEAVPTTASEVPTTASEVPVTTTSDVPSPTETGTPVPTTTTEPPAPLPDATSTPTG
jgi:hypothetical protein